MFHDPTTGASNDIEKATSVARAMVTQYGMTERLGAVRYGQADGEVFLGRDYGHQRDYSEEVAAAIDEEVRKLIETAHQEAYEILVENRDVLDALVTELLERETLDKEEVARIFEPLSMRPHRPAWTGSARRAPSERGPVDFVPSRVSPTSWTSHGSTTNGSTTNGSTNGSANGSSNGSANGSTNGSANGAGNGTSTGGDPAGTAN